MSDKTIMVYSECLFGNQVECIFQCHCGNNNSSNNNAIDNNNGTGIKNNSCDPLTGSCLSGSDYCGSNIEHHLYKWRGPGCQIGNIAFGKVASSNSDVDPGNSNISWREPEKWNNASHAVDGSLDRYKILVHFYKQTLSYII